MICRKCGCILDEKTKVCAFCGEQAEPGSVDLMTRTVGDDGASEIRAAMPGLINLQELAEVPQDKEMLIIELTRLQGYFAHVRSKYATLGDLWMMRSQNAEPSLLSWTIGGFISTLFFYLILSGFLPGTPWTFFFVLWLGVTSVGYVQAGKAYEKRKAQLDADIRGMENEVRDFYNHAERCFLPFDYSDPQIIRELIIGLTNGTITSFRDYRVQ